MGECYYPYAVGPVVRWHLDERKYWDVIVDEFGREDAAALWRMMLPVELVWHSVGARGAG